MRDGQFIHMEKPAPFLNVQRRGTRLCVGFSGDWVIENAAHLVRQLNIVQPVSDEIDRVVFFCSGIETLDTSGAWLIHKRATELQTQGFPTDFQGFKEAHFKIVKEVAAADDSAVHPQGRTGLSGSLEWVGRIAVGIAVHLGGVLVYFGRVTSLLLAGIGQPRRFRFPSIVRHMHKVGIDAAPIVALLAFLISIVLTYQGAIQLRQFGAQIYTVDLVTVSVLREMGVVLTAILIAGRSGSAFTAEIGVMEINEEVDAMQTIGMDPFEVLVMPRVIALIVMLPLLTVLADVAGLVGGAISAKVLFNVPFELFASQARAAVTPWTFWIGLIKAPVFALLIATVATFRGMQASGSAEDVGRLTTVSVVQSIFLVIMADAAFSVIFSEAGV